MARSSRNDTSKDIKPVGGAGEGSAPLAWLDDHGPDDSLETLRQYRLIPIVKVVQGLTARELKTQFGEGSAIIGGSTRVIPFDEKDPKHFQFVPVFMYTEFLTWSDRKDNSSPAILGRDFNVDSVIARKARDAKRRREKYGDKDQFTCRHVEHLNFAGFIYGEHELAFTPVILSYSKGEFKKGRAWSNAILLRRSNQRQVPLWAQVWEFVIGHRRNDEGEWFGLDFRNPTVGSPYIKDDEVDFFKGQFLELKELHEKRLLVADHPEEEGEDLPDVSESAEY